MVAAALIGAAGSLLGGLLGKSKQKVYTNDQGIMDSAKGAREAAAEYGFNPLTLLGATGGAGAVYGGQNTMGSAISDAALLLADGLKDKSAEKAQLENIQLQNEVLRAQVRDLTIRPKVGGIYAGNVSTPGVGNGRVGSVSDQSVGVGIGDRSGAAPNVDGSWFPRALTETSYADPRREVQNQSVPTTSGFMVVDSPYLPGPLPVPTLDGDEPLHWYDYPDLIPATGIALGRASYKAGSRLRASYEAQKGGGYGFASDGWGYALQPPKTPAKSKASRSFLQWLGNPFPAN